MSRLQEFANAKGKDGQTGIRAFVSGAKAKIKKMAKMAYPVIKKELQDMAITVVPFVAGAAAAVGFGLTGHAMGIEPGWNLAGAAVAGYETHKITKKLMQQKFSRG